LLSAPGDQTRPILDRAKTVLFDMLGHRLAQPGVIPPIAVLDLFAGTGTLGLESLSRGARYCCFVERHRATANLLRKNLDALGVIGEADVLDVDATVCDFASPPPDEDGLAQYELVFIDPPYRQLSGPKPVGGIVKLLDRLASSAIIAPSALIVVRHEAKRKAPDLSPLIERTRRDVGHMTLRIMGREGDDILSLDEDSP